MLLLLTEVRAACVSSRNRLQRVAGIAETVKGSTRHETTLLSHFLGVGPSVGPARIAVAPDPSSLGRDASFVGTTAEAVARAQARRLSRARLRGASTMSHAISLEPGPPSPRQCGRCRSVFPGDTVLDPSAAPKWWACAGCRRALFPRAPRKVQPRQRVSVRPGQDGDVSPSWFVEGGERDERAQRVARCSIELAPDPQATRSGRWRSSSCARATTIPRRFGTPWPCVVHSRETIRPTRGSSGRSDSCRTSRSFSVSRPTSSTRVG